MNNDGFRNTVNERTSPLKCARAARIFLQSVPIKKYGTFIHHSIIRPPHIVTAPSPANSSELDSVRVNTAFSGHF